MQERISGAALPAWQRAAKAHRLKMNLAKAEEQQWRAMAQTLQEDFCEILAAANFKLTSLQEREQCADTARELRAVEDLIGCASRSARSLALQLSPPVLHAVGIVPALEWLGEEVERLCGLKVRIYDDGAPKPLAGLSRTTLYRAARELLINVARHAGSGVAELCSLRDGDRLMLAVSDDGCGFDYEAALISPSSPGGYGLLWLRERIALIGGEMHVDSCDGGGTNVTLTLPVAGNTGPDVR